MNTIIRAYRLINLLSIDIAAGAVICAAFFAKVFDAQLRPYGLGALGVTVWIIYTADHLLDTRKLKSQASSERHRLHQKHYKTLWLLVFLFIVVDVVLIFYIKRPVLFRGFALSGFVIIYLLVQRYLRVLKEWVAAILYAGGVLLPSVVLSSLNFLWPQLLLIFSFFLTAWINLLIFSWFSREEDVRDNHNSFVTIMGSGLTLAIIWTLIALNALITVIAVVMPPVSMAALIVATMNVPLGIIVIKKSYFERDDRYRLLGDAVFLIPVLYLFL